MSDENGLTLPLDKNVLTFWDGAQLDFDLGHGQHIGGCSERGEERLDGGLGTGSGQQTHGTHHEVGEVSVGVLGSLVQVRGVVWMLVVG